MKGKELYFEEVYKGKTYKIRVSSRNDPSEEAIKECNRLVNKIMNELYMNENKQSKVQ